MTRRARLAAIPAGMSSLARDAAYALAAARAPSPGSVALLLSDDEELARLNRLHMGESGPTDVLSFPLLPPDAFPPHPGKQAAPADDARREPPFETPMRRRTHLGDIVISVQRAIDQAHLGRGGQTGDVAWSAADELGLLVVHGVLHICGWDHADETEREHMRKLEREVLGTS